MNFSARLRLKDRCCLLCMSVLLGDCSAYGIRKSQPLDVSLWGVMVAVTSGDQKSSLSALLPLPYFSLPCRQPSINLFMAPDGYSASAGEFP